MSNELEVKQEEKMEKQAFQTLKMTKENVRWEVFLPGLAIFGAAAIMALANRQWMAQTFRTIFNWTLETFGWLYAITVMSALLICVVLFVSKVGAVRIGGKDAKATMPFWTWFAMTLTGGIAVGVVTWAVNEPLIYYGNVWGELNTVGITPHTAEAYYFALGQTIMHWTFLPYGIYALCGVLVAYTYFNRKKQLTISSTLEPLFGPKISGKVGSSIIDTLSMMALALGITSGLAMAITMITEAIMTYTTWTVVPYWLIIVCGAVVVALFTLSSSVGLDKGLRRLGWINVWLFYGLMLLLFIVGPTFQMLRNSTIMHAVWFDNFFAWGLDPFELRGAALTRSWTMFNWAIWMAYAPVTGIFLAMLAKGRTIREFLIVNLLLPSVFSVVWFSIWSTSSLEMQVAYDLYGAAYGVNLVGVIQETGSAIMALWVFLQNLPFGLGTVVLPLTIVVLALSYITAADATLTKIGSICLRNVPIGTQPPALIKVIWGVLIGVLGITLVATAERLAGVAGVRELASAGGFLVLFIFTAMIATAIKVFFIDKIEE